MEQKANVNVSHLTQIKSDNSLGPLTVLEKCLDLRLDIIFQYCRGPRP